jgi:hypothetical protein
VGFAGQRLALPPNLDSQVAGVINSCWASKPSDRPSFAQVLDKLRSFKDLPACPPPPAAAAPADNSSGSLAASARASSGGGAAASAAGSGGGAAGVSRQGSELAGAGSSGVQQQEQPLIML